MPNNKSLTSKPMKVLFKNQQHDVFAGDRIIQAKKDGFGLIKHHVIVADGKIAENHRSSGVRYISIDELNQGGEILEIQPFKGNECERYQILKRIEERVNTPYNLQTYNCEHFVNDVLIKKPVSKQIETANNTMIGVFGLGVSFSIVGLATKNKKMLLPSFLFLIIPVFYLLSTAAVQSSRTPQLSQ